MSGNPYTRLRDSAREFVRKIETLKRLCIGTYKGSVTDIDFTDFRTTIKIGQRFGKHVEVTCEWLKVTGYTILPKVIDKA